MCREICQCQYWLANRPHPRPRPRPNSASADTARSRFTVSLDRRQYLCGRWTVEARGRPRVAAIAVRTVTQCPGSASDYRMCVVLRRGTCMRGASGSRPVPLCVGGSLMSAVGPGREQDADIRLCSSIAAVPPRGTEATTYPALQPRLAAASPIACHYYTHRPKRTHTQNPKSGVVHV